MNAQIINLGDRRRARRAAKFEDEVMKNLQLMFVGMLIGFGLPFLIAGMTMQLTGTKMRVDIVKEDR